MLYLQWTKRTEKQKRFRQPSPFSFAKEYRVNGASAHDCMSVVGAALFLLSEPLKNPNLFILSTVVLSIQSEKVRIYYYCLATKDLRLPLLLFFHLALTLESFSSSNVAIAFI